MRERFAVRPPAPQQPGKDVPDPDGPNPPIESPTRIQAQPGPPMCGNSARRLGLDARKGRIALGADADFAILDPRQSFTVDAKTSYSSAKWSPYDGWTTQGRITRTILRGRTIFDGEKVVTQGGFGQFLPGPGYVA